ncbi:MAG: DUF1015 domain-containing protein, partial [Coriobacteriia bacterium]|nr:DUF1015 domain-containing protein [Coriobacteriia bacterium]
MARVRAFRAHTFARAVADISDLTAPPYDVISPGEREALLARSPHNVVALELPEGPLDPGVPGNRYETGAARWTAWQAEETIIRDAIPTLYVLEQRFTLGEQDIRRRAFIVELELEPFDAGVVLPHERTLPKALGDRFNLTRACAANLSQVLGLYPDSEKATDALFEAVMATEPTMTAVDAMASIARSGPRPTQPSSTRSRSRSPTSRSSSPTVITATRPRSPIATNAARPTRRLDGHR